MGDIKIGYYFYNHDEIPKELHNDILKGNPNVKSITDVSIEDINSMYEGLSLYNVVTSIKQYMGDL
mgnify:CR=1 FL=1